MITPENIHQWLQKSMSDAKIQVEGDGHHFEVVIVDDGFLGKSLIERHQMVYTVLGNKMKADIHALSMKTLTHNEYLLKENSQ